MMQLRTYPVCAGEAGIFVHWSTGLRTNGVVEVNIPLGVEDRLAIAEAIAVRTLLFDRRVFGAGIITGRGCRVLVTSQGIQESLARENPDDPLTKYCEYLTYEWSEISLGMNEVEPGDELFGNSETWAIDQVDWRSKRFRKPGELWNTALGPLFITHHAIDQYGTRLFERDGIKVQCAKRSLLKALNPKIQMVQIELSRDENDAKTEKYGPDMEAEHWASPHSTLRFTILRKPQAGAAILLTCFWGKKQDLPKNVTVRA